MTLLFLDLCFLEMPYSDIVEQNPISKMKWEIKKGNISEERLRYIVVTKQRPNCSGLSEQRFISQSCKACWDPWEPPSSVWSLSNEKCFHQVDPQSRRVTSTVTVAEEEGAGGSSTGSRMLQHRSDPRHFLHCHQQSDLILSPICREPGEGGRPQRYLVSSNSLPWWLILQFLNV